MGKKEKEPVDKRLYKNVQIKREINQHMSFF